MSIQELANNEQRAILELKMNISNKYSLNKLVLFGSKARGDSDAESDIDLLALLDNVVDFETEREVFHLAYDMELKHDVVVGVIVQNSDYWQKRCAGLPIKKTIDREGIAV